MIVGVEAWGGFLLPLDQGCSGSMERSLLQLMVMNVVNVDVHDRHGSALR
jgi:hypothetical protein